MISTEANEVWKSLPNYPTYLISNLGRIKAMDKVRCHQPGRFLKGWLNPRGYQLVRLRNSKGEEEDRQIHRLVLEAFVGSRPEGYETNHKDGIKTNNIVTNLEWCTHSENLLHAHKNGLEVNWKGHEHILSKLKDGEVWLIRNLLKKKIIKQTTIARMFNVSPSTIHLIKIYKRYINSGF